MLRYPAAVKLVPEEVLVDCSRRIDKNNEGQDMSTS